MAKGLTPRKENYAQWYNDLVIKADLAENSVVRGCMVIKPYGYALWEKTQAELDKLLSSSWYRRLRVCLNPSNSSWPTRSLSMELGHFRLTRLSALKSGDRAAAGIAPKMRIPAISQGSEFLNRAILLPPNFPFQSGTCDTTSGYCIDCFGMIGKL